MPITNSLAFLFTVLGEWWAEGKVISRGRWCYSVYFTGADLIYRYLAWYGVCPGWHCAVRAVQSLLSSIVTSGFSITGNLMHSTVLALSQCKGSGALSHVQVY